jgi:hypothetical protein
MSRSPTLDNPDFVLIDLDPQDCPYDMIVEAALLVREKLDAIGLKGYPKTTGGDGMHIYIPLEPVYSYEESRTFAEILAHLVQRDRPELFTTPRAVAKRQKGRVYFDWMQNGKTKTIAAPYVLRAYPGAPVATPLAWSEVQPGLTPGQFNIYNAPERFAKTGDLFAGADEACKGWRNGPLQKLEKLLNAGIRPSARGRLAARATGAASQAAPCARLHRAHLHGFSGDPRRPAVRRRSGHRLRRGVPGGRPVMVVGEQKGRDTKQKLYRNFGMPKPEGYRKALRVMQLASKFGRPIVTLLDTPGAYPGIDAEERGQAEAIARNLREMARLAVPVITVCIGEGGSGGALALGVGNRVLMLENAIYSVISPESCAAIIWRDSTKAELAAAALKLTAEELLKLGLIDGVVGEPAGGAHEDADAAARFPERQPGTGAGGSLRTGPRPTRRAAVRQVPPHGQFLRVKKSVWLGILFLRWSSVSSFIRR